MEGAPPLRRLDEAHELAFFAVVLRRPDEPLDSHAATYNKMGHVHTLTQTNEQSTIWAG
jgi:hypothetical protein